MAKKAKKKPVWKGQKRNAIGLPFTFTKYILYDNKLVIRKGFLNIKSKISSLRFPCLEEYLIMAR